MPNSKNNSIKISSLFLLLSILMLFIVGMVYLIFLRDTPEKTNANLSETLESSSPSKTLQSSSLMTTKENNSETIQSQEEINPGQTQSVLTPSQKPEFPVKEKIAFMPDQYEKVLKFFGPLPEIKQNHTYEHTKIKAIYVNNMNYLDNYFEMVKDTDVDTFIIDVKESWGLLYESQVPLAREVGAIMEDRDLVDIFQRCHDHGIRVIARIVCFKDTTLASKRPDLTIATKDDTPIEFPLEGYNTFANPYDQDVWQYLIDIATEVIGFGADEIQFDYVRFPSGQPADGMIPYFGKEEDVPERYSAINRFLQTAVVEIQENQNIPVGADLFSIVMTSDLDGLAIGQNWNYIGLTGINNICPMIYPSHYANASVGGVLGNGQGTYLGNNLYEAPDLFPYEVVLDAFVDGMPAIEQEDYAEIRPYLQAFTAEYLPAGYYLDYGAKEIHEQIQATYDSGFDEWVLWNVQLEYPPGTFVDLP